MTGRMQKLAAVHGMLWDSDPWYRRSWFAWPQAASLLAAGWLIFHSPLTRPVSEAPWAPEQQEPAEQQTSAKDMDALRNRAASDPAEFDKLKATAAQGNSFAQFSLATLYDPEFHLSKLVAPDANVALSWYMKAAQQGHSVAQFDVGRMYKEGKYGIPQNLVTTLLWYEKSAAAGFAVAERELAILYRDGTGVPKDETHAIRLFRAAADKGDAYAQAEVGAAYERGAGGLPADQAQAVAWLQKAAVQGDVFAARNLGIHYRDGTGVAADGKVALQWFQKAADAGEVLCGS